MEYPYTVANMNESLSKLTPTQVKILTDWVDGMSALEIAKKRNCKDRTVEWHIANIYKIFGVRSREELIGRLKA